MRWGVKEVSMRLRVEGSEHEVGGKGSEHEVWGEGSEHKTGGEGSEHGSSVSEDVGANGLDQEKDQPTLPFFDCIVQGEQKCDGNIVLSCFEAALHALRCQFPHVKKLIIQSDNARNLAGKQTKLLLPHVCSAAGIKLVAYYHNEAQSGKDVCDTHFSHQQTIFEAGRWWAEDIHSKTACSGTDGEVHHQHYSTADKCAPY